MSGYSGTPLAQKPGIKVGWRLFVKCAPANYLQLLAPVPAQVRTVARLSATTDVAHVFVTGRAPLARALKSARAGKCAGAARGR